MNRSELTTRAYTVGFETREEDENGIVEGRPIVFNSVADLGYFFEEIAPGALDTTDLNDVRFCLNHDTSYVYARSRRNNAQSTMQLFPNDAGLDIKAMLAIGESAKAKDLYTAISRGDIDKMSFMFAIGDEEWRGLETDKPTRIIKRIDSVVEVSAVTFPAYDSTMIDARSKEALDNARSALENARQSRAKSVDTDLELAKAKFTFLSKL